MSEDFEVVERDQIIAVTLTRPRKYNAMSTEMLEAIRNAALRLEQRRDLRVMLFRARGKYFSAGRDISESLTPDFQGSTLEARAWYRQSMQSICDIFERVEKPIVAAHQGPCLGGALELALSCDFRLASASASFALPEIKLGVLPGSGGTSRLARLVGPHWARWMVMAAQSVTAEQAVSMGLAHHLYPDEQFEETVWNFCQELVALPPETVGMAKLAIELTADLAAQQARQVERLANSVLFIGDEHAEYIARFKNRKRDG